MFQIQWYHNNFNTESNHILQGGTKWAFHHCESKSAIIQLPVPTTNFINFSL